MVAGFIYEYSRTKTFYEALKLAAACGSATAYSNGLATIDLVNELKDQIEIKILKEATHENN